VRTTRARTPLGRPGHAKTEPHRKNTSHNTTSEDGANEKGRNPSKEHHDVENKHPQISTSTFCSVVVRAMSTPISSRQQTQRSQPREKNRNGAIVTRHFMSSVCGPGSAYFRTLFRVSFGGPVPAAPAELRCRGRRRRGLAFYARTHTLDFASLFFSCAF